MSADITAALSGVESRADDAAWDAFNAANTLDDIKRQLRELPTSKDVIRWLEQGDQIVEILVNRAAKRLARRINSQRIKPLAPRMKRSANRRRSGEGRSELP